MENISLECLLEMCIPLIFLSVFLTEVMSHLCSCYIYVALSVGENAEFPNSNCICVFNPFSCVRASCFMPFVDGIFYVLNGLKFTLPNCLSIGMFRPSTLKAILICLLDTFMSTRHKLVPSKRREPQLGKRLRKIWL